MLKLNRLTDYAVVALSHMARKPDALATVPHLAAATGLQQPTIAKLMKQLVAGAIVTSQRGANGGYCLARPADEITVAEIITVLEGPIILTSCVHGADTHCEVESVCPMRGNWDKVNVALRAALDGITLTDMSAPIFATTDRIFSKTAENPADKPLNIPPGPDVTDTPFLGPLITGS